MKKYILLLLLFIIISCQSKKNKSQGGDDELLEIKGEQVLQERFMIQDIFVVDSLLITKNHKSASHLFSIFDKRENLIMEFGQLGVGPLDFEEEVRFNNQIYYNENNDICIWLYEIHHHRLRLVNISKVIKERSVCIEREVDIKPNLNLEDLFYIDSTLVIGNVNNLDIDMDKLRFYNPILGKMEKTVALSPKVKNDNKKDISTIQYDYNSLFINRLRCHSSKGLVAVMMEMDRMDFMNMKGEITQTITNSSAKKNAYRLSDFPKGSKRKVFYLDVATANKNVYTLYNGKDTYETLNLKNNVIKIFDWEGKLRKCLKPQESLFRIAIDEENAVLYGVSDDDYKIYKYDLNDVINIRIEEVK